MKKNEDFLRLPNWYPVLAGHTFLTSFVKLRAPALAALADGENADDYEEDDDAVNPAVEEVLEDLRQPMAAIRGNCFVCVDCCAPTDTERFYNKRGAVYSPKSAWKYLSLSEKVRNAVRRGDVEYICIRPFRRMNRTREFRLFIHNGHLNAMSQYCLLRHFRRLEGVKNRYWEMAADFVNDIAWLLPLKDLVMDIYFTSANEIMIVDLNPWGAPTDPLLLQRWERDWERPAGIVLMDPPIRISGDVNVSF